MSKTKKPRNIKAYIVRNSSTLDEHRELAREVKINVEFARNLIGFEAILRKGRHIGRLGKIEAVAASTEHGLTYLVRVYTVDRKSFLNDAPARSYWPLEAFEVVL